MKTPDFFNTVPPITLRDPLAQMLGAAAEGILDYTYEDCVKLAGHSCPTVAGAYLMIRTGLRALYGEEIPVRGEIKVLIKGRLGEGTVGVIANVASMITGATEKGGFHGLGGKFDRRDLLFYDVDMEGDMALERSDTGERAVLSYDPSSVAADSRLGELLPLVISGRAEKSAEELFRVLWQEKVRTILMDYKDNTDVIKCRIESAGEKQ